MLSITKEFLFDAAHQLLLHHKTPEENRKIYGKCYQLHGHTYRLLVSVSGPVDETGMVVNFTDLKKIITQNIIDRYDHRYLNELDEFKNIPTTVENIILQIDKTLKDKFKDLNLVLESLTLYETPTSSATIS